MCEMPSSVIDRKRPGCDVEADPGDSAFAAFLRAESDVLVGYLRGKQVDPEDARDIAQEAQMRLLRYRQHGRDVLRPLLYRIALNLLRDRWRQRAVAGEVSAHGDALDVETLMADGPGPEQIAVQRQELERARQAIADLPPHCRGVYLLNRVEGMSYPRIARHMGVSVKAVEKQISKALALLRLSMDRGPGA
ncbi:sigma-70 family RNA polymerase sigma factor [Luteimonas sp. XNQY3]|nr:sigma-70 family RNA polymerase sigma factor [Luteimonas sp. XNQY3]MCD9005326.1 sigma-70 family RNA polymerase sigma factor [Luteimonas sp. XNQY3]